MKGFWALNFLVVVFSGYHKTSLAGTNLTTFSLDVTVASESVIIRILLIALLKG